MRILVTGGAGFIGSQFCKLLNVQRPDWQVVNLDALTYAGNLENLSSLEGKKNYKFVKGNILDEKLVDTLTAEIDTVVNFAAESHVDRSILGPDAFIQTNIVGTQRILDACRKHKKSLVQISTDEVYGSLGEQGRFTEDTPLAPNSPYSASKASADLLCRAYHHTFDLDVRVTRCSNNYGPNQFPEKLIPLMIKNAVESKSLPVYGDGMNVRDWIYVGDHAEAILSVLEKGKSGEVYNIGSDNEWPNIEIVKFIIRELGKDDSLIKYVKDRPGHDRRYAIDSRKVHDQTGWKAKTRFEDGMKSTISWYIKNQKWLNNIVSGDYQKYYDLQYSQRN